MTSPGLLSVRAGLKNRQIEDLLVRLERPPVSRLFIGQPPEAVVKTVPYLYTLCAHAQRAAAQAALAAAADEQRRAVDDGALWIEFLHENLWRLLLDWPKALGLPQASDAFANWRAARHGPVRVAETRTLLDGVLNEMAARCREKLACNEDDAASVGLAELRPEAWLAYWQGCTSEMPANRRSPTVAAAYLARLAEVGLAIEALAGASPYPVTAAGAAGWGVGQTLTARGVLTHAVHVVDGRVANYRVWAPTDSYFADAEALDNLLDGRQFVDGTAARQAVEQAILALDPCLPYELEINDA